MFTKARHRQFLKPAVSGSPFRTVCCLPVDFVCLVWWLALSFAFAVVACALSKSKCECKCSGVSFTFIVEFINLSLGQHFE